MPAAFVGVVCEIDVGDLCKERAGVFCKRVEGETVNNYCEDLMLRRNSVLTVLGLSL
jgi:hypothetical protein